VDRSAADHGVNVQNDGGVSRRSRRSLFRETEIDRRSAGRRAWTPLRMLPVVPICRSDVCADFRK